LLKNIQALLEALYGRGQFSLFEVHISKKAVHLGLACQVAGILKMVPGQLEAIPGARPRFTAFLEMCTSKRENCPRP